jgi:prevent-host-death family protein
MKYVSISDARKRLADLVGSVERTMVVRNNRPVAVILHMEDYEALVAAQAREHDPQRLARLVEAHREVQAGRRQGVVDFSRGDAEELLELADRLAAEDERRAG